jgi:hypothetical protein
MSDTSRSASSIRRLVQVARMRVHGARLADDRLRYRRGQVPDDQTLGF